MARKSIKSRSFRRRKAGSTRKSLSAAWRLSNRRRKGGLNRRTTLANLRAIKGLKRSIETNFIQSVNATQVNNFGGQYMLNIPVDSDGNTPDPAGGAAIPVVLRPMAGMGQGDNEGQRAGSQVTMQSLTLKVKTVPGDVYNRLRFFLVKDSDPVLSDGATLNPSSLPQLLQGSSQHELRSEELSLQGAQVLDYLCFPVNCCYRRSLLSSDIV